MNNPVTSQGLVVVNCNSDVCGMEARAKRSKTSKVISGSGGSNDDMYSLMMHDLCFRLKNPQVSRPPTLQAPSARVFSSFDMLPINDAEKAIFMGISSTTMGFDDARGRRSDKVAVKVAGSDTIENTGPYNIEIGDTLCWQMPDIGGSSGRKRNRSKYRCSAEVVPLRVMLDDDKADERDLERRIIGTALSFAQPGEAGCCTND
eukprot:gene26377-32352_t